MSNLSADPMLFSYNTYRATPHATVEVEARPIPTTDGRGVKFVKYVIDVKDVIGQVNQDDDATTDTTLDGLREKLTAYGGELHLEEMGFGSLIVNVPAAGPELGSPGDRRDAVWGPKPTLLKWVGHGGVSAEIHLVIEVHVAECPDVPRERGIVEWHTSVTWSVGKGGYQTRTVEGAVQIAQTRASVDSTRLVDHADRLREAVVAGLPAIRGFRRVHGPWKLDPSKCVLTFSVQDVEWGDSSDNYPPPGVTEIDADHTVTTNKVFGGVTSGTIRATYEVTRETAKGATFAAFFQLFQARLQAARDTRAPGLGQCVLMKSFTLSEPAIYGKGEGSKAASYSATYQFLANLESLLKASGLFRRVTGGAGGDWSRWSQSLSNTATHPRGNAKLAFSPNEALIDLCHQGSYRLTPGGGTRTLRGDFLPGRPPGGRLRNDPPDPYASWLTFVSTIRLETIDETRVMKTLPTAPPLAAGDYSLSTAAPTPPAFPDLSKIGQVLEGQPLQKVEVAGKLISSLAPYADSGGSGEDVIQVAAKPTHVVIIRGYAARAGYQIDPPRLVDVGGARPIPANREGYGFEHWIADSWFGVPIFLCRWNFRYVLEGTPTALPVMGTPVLTQ